ncbi:MAG: hypothetical protein UX31_C0006G0011 [Candidatus Nomurabacteria bacterium GW2011_GWA1_46_11]|uniref:Uncharacterized protein n=2 Tax=Parcubacteria group TaxID=1794811 RepID=A0A1G1YVG6_9BACT|nr:MAG: hypothetical protein UX31_C0006G0011 [Candidatus Nomurabacteria bacterium GW2011_GWA1_46_11]OGY56362.1 MAG: hypothetical protein A2119_02460 [Candidatus Colwellbacteria bacterium GWA2_46_10]
MDDYPANTWTDEDVEKMRSNFAYRKPSKCPICGIGVKIKREEGPAYVKKKYVKTHYFVAFNCPGCNRHDVRTYKK